MSEHQQDAWSDTNSINEDDSYIEMEFTTSPTCYNNLVDDGEEEDESNRENRLLRISISSTISVSLPQVQKESPTIQNNVGNVAATDHEAPSNMLSLMSFSADNSTKSYSEHETTNLTPVGSTHLEYSSVSKNDEQRVEVELSAQTWLPNTRKQPNLTPTTTCGGIMKLLIKFRCKKFGALLASLIKPRHPSQANNNNVVHKPSEKCKTFFQYCYQKRLPNTTNGRCNIKRNCKHWDLEEYDSMCGSFRSSKNSSMDLGAIRGIFNAMGMSNISQKGSRSKRSSVQSSCDTTPIHEGFSTLHYCESTNIQAAIAYCKSSFGQTSNFSP